MRMIVFILVILQVIFSTVHSGTSPRIVCYFTSRAVSRPGVGRYGIDDIPVELCTHIIYSYIGVTNGTNEVLILNPEVDEEQSGLRNFTSLRSKHPRVKFLVALGGWDEGGSKYSQMASQNSSRTHFIKSVVDFLKNYEFDGLDLHWQYPGAKDRNGTAADKDNFLYLVQELKAAFTETKKNWELTAGIPLTEEKLTAGYRVSELCQELDAIHVMSYDLRGVEGGVADVHSPLYKRPDALSSLENINVDSGLSLLEKKGCPRQKLVVGIPFYGRSFTLPEENNNYKVGANINQTVGEGNPGPYTNQTGVMAYYEICSAVDKKKSNWTKKWDEHGKCPYAYKGNQWIGYEDPQSINIKLNWIKKKGYLGAMTWTVDMDDFRGLCGKKSPLVRLINKLMKSYVVPTAANATTTVETKQVESEVDNRVVNATISNSSVIVPTPLEASDVKQVILERKLVENKINDTVVAANISNSSEITSTLPKASVVKQETKRVENPKDETVVNSAVPNASVISFTETKAVVKQETVQLPPSNPQNLASMTRKPTYISLIAINFIFILYFTRY